VSNQMPWTDASGCAEAAATEAEPCPQCKELNDGDAKFHNNCGHNLALESDWAMCVSGRKNGLRAGGLGLNWLCFG